MGLDRISLGLAALFVCLGLVTGLIMQLELAQQGIQFASDGEGMQRLQQVYESSVYLHAASLSIGLPLALCAAYPVSKLAARMKSAGLHIVAVALLLFGPVIIVAGPYLQEADSPARHLSTWSLVLTVALSLIGALTLISLMPRPRRSAILYFVVGVLLIALSFNPLWVYRHQGADAVLRDTYYLTGLYHIVGLALICLCLSVLAARAPMNGAPVPLPLAMLSCAALFGAGVMMIAPTLQLGLMGMPRGYIDYPETFSDLHRQVSVWAIVMMLIALLSAGYALIRYVVRPPSAAEVFD